MKALRPRAFLFNYLRENLTAMRNLLPLLFIGFVSLTSCNGREQPKCEDIDGIKVTNFSWIPPNYIPPNYTGVAFLCEDGKVSLLVNYKDGKQDGVERGWFENGRIAYESNYKDGVKDGVERKWFKLKDQLQFESNYKDGELDGVHKGWSFNGRKETESNYKDGEWDGVMRHWNHENGRLYYEGNWKDGKEDGLCRSWWGKNGQLRSEENWEDGKITDDKVIHYNEDGSILKTVYYKDGEESRCEGDCD